LPLVDLAQIPFLLFVLVVSLTIHEAAHAWAADLLGDPTASAHGRLAFSPFVQLEPVGAVIYPAVAFLSGFSFVGWGRPVPVDRGELGSAWRQRLLMIAAAGPLASLLLAVAAAGSLRAGLAATGAATDAVLGPLLLRALELNVVIVLLNFVPVPPLDAGTFLTSMLRGRTAASLERYRPAAVALLFVLTVTGPLPALLNPARASLTSALL
jgi:Zn-dependent protease